jgi:hypothetical protein
VIYNNCIATKPNNIFINFYVREESMKKLAIITMISVFLLFSNSIIHAQGFTPFWQFPNFPGQYGQQWGFQPYTPGYFSSYNPIGQYGQQWGFQPYTPGYFSSFNSIPQPWSSQLRLSSESSPGFMFNSSPAIPSFAGMPNNLSYAPSINGFGYQSMGNWGSPFLYLPPLPSNYYNPVGGRPQGPFYSYDEPLIACGPLTSDAYKPGAVWNLNWKLKDTDVTIDPYNGDWRINTSTYNEESDRKSITVKKGKTIGIAFPNTEEFEANTKWDLDPDDLDENIVEKISVEQFPGYWYMDFRNGPMYKNTHDQWIFKAKSAGTTTLKFDHSTIEGPGPSIEIEIKVTN